MLLFKIFFRINSSLKKIFFKIIYGKKIKFGKNVHFRKGFTIFIEKNGFLRIGDGCFFNNYCSINVMDTVKIDDNSIFGENVKIYDHNHIFNNKDFLIKNQGFKTSQINIGKNVWVGSNTSILRKAKIGDNCVIGAGSVINEKIDSNTIVRNENKLVKEAIRY